MNPTPLRPETFPERVLWFTILGTYGLYYLGAQFVWVPLMAWGMTGYLIWRWWQESPQIPRQEQIRIPGPVWIWLIAVTGIALALIIGHVNFDLGMGLTIKSLINRWGRQWALFALFPLLGCLPIRPQIIYRAACILAFQSFILTCITFTVVFILKLEDIAFISPFSAFGGGEIFYEVKIFGSLYDTGSFRLELFAPWAPALGLAGNIYFWLAWQESDRRWRWLGLLGATIMILSSVSRLGMVTLPLVAILIFLLKHLHRPFLLMGLGSASFLGGLFSHQILTAFARFRDSMIQARAGSSKTRFMLQQLALNRWWNEARIWGHGTIEPTGPKSVGFMPIGTHHQWLGTLYSHGAVGCGLLALAFLSSLVALLPRLWDSALAQTAVAIWLVLFCFSWGENLESLAYIFWPGLVIMGLAYCQISAESRA
ncbi:O-antigen ligase domain-containing protein [Lyngbya confervoides]|uniref:O-antigen ligase domain-containing protein n=1 Tax=Lyngbya confervoides BDU141951 TaxID=1574623 RepID=A0ABD4T8C2_9CYAN|nr:O-antigen ligase domain-containing protein [Lyngbya confervoides]MCM1984694.1 O-antigen ligase domain-containing protein [Lyngbya confervoides BDU141951]